MVRQPDATMQPTPQDNQLMSKHRVLSFRPQLRLERRGHDGQNETEQPDHSASLGDSITSSTRIRFSVLTIVFWFEFDFLLEELKALEQKAPARGPFLLDRVLCSFDRPCTYDFPGWLSLEHHLFTRKRIGTFPRLGRWLLHYHELCKARHKKNPVLF